MADKHEIIAMLQHAYCMEIETVLNYIANSINPDGVRAEQVKQSLEKDIPEEILHAQQLGHRIKQLGGSVPGSGNVKLGAQRQPPADTTDIVDVIEGVIEAEQAACKHYRNIIDATDGVDPVTQDLCVRLMADEEEHLVQFQGFLKEYRKEQGA